jgi:DNA modification methylase
MKEITRKDYLDFVRKNRKSLPKYLHMGQHKNIILQPKDFKLETTTLWHLPRCKDWATHSLNARFRANWDPEVARNIILRYSKPGDIILDPFVGSGTTLIESRLLGRKGIGVDLSREAIILARDRLNFGTGTEQKTCIGDARKLDLIKSSSIDLIATHPPYLKFVFDDSKSSGGDLANLNSMASFAREMKKVAKECFRVLKQGHYCAVLMGDAKKHRDYVPVAYGVMQSFQAAGFVLEDDIIKVQSTKITPELKKISIKDNRILLVHEHLLVFRKPQIT